MCACVDVFDDDVRVHFVSLRAARPNQPGRRRSHTKILYSRARLVTEPRLVASEQQARVQHWASAVRTRRALVHAADAPDTSHAATVFDQ